MPNSRFAIASGTNEELAFRADLLALGASLAGAEDGALADAMREASRSLASRCPRRATSLVLRGEAGETTAGDGDVGFGIQLAGSQDLAALAASLLAAAARSSPPRSCRTASSNPRLQAPDSSPFF